jgi:hypothetical protein
MTEAVEASVLLHAGLPPLLFVDGLLLNGNGLVDYHLVSADPIARRLSPSTSTGKTFAASAEQNISFAVDQPMLSPMRFKADLTNYSDVDRRLSRHHGGTMASPAIILAGSSTPLAPVVALSSFHDLSFIFDLRMPGWSQRLQVLDLSQNLLTRVPVEVCTAGMLPRLDTLYMHGNRIDDLLEVAEAAWSASTSTLAATAYFAWAAANATLHASTAARQGVAMDDPLDADPAAIAEALTGTPCALHELGSRLSGRAAVDLGGLIADVNHPVTRRRVGAHRTAVDILKRVARVRHEQGQAAGGNFVSANDRFRQRRAELCPYTATFTFGEQLRKVSFYGNPFSNNAMGGKALNGRGVGGAVPPHESLSAEQYRTAMLALFPNLTHLDKVAIV